MKTEAELMHPVLCECRVVKSEKEARLANIGPFAVGPARRLFQLDRGACGFVRRRRLS